MKSLFLILCLALSLSANAQQKPEKIVLEHKNTVTLRGPVTSQSMTELKLKLSELAIKRGSADYKIYLVLDSPGGSISAGLSFIEFARHFRDVETVTLFAASMAAYIAQAMPGKRHIIKTGTMMFHRARVRGFGGQLVEGEFESRYRYIRAMILDMENTNADRLKLKLADYKKKIKDEWWLYGAEAKLKNAVDGLASILCSPALIKDVKKVNIRSLFSSIEVKQSACPTI